MTRYEILKEAHKLLRYGDEPGICLAIRMVLNKLGYYNLSSYYFPLLNIDNALKFNAECNKSFWWKPGRYGIFSGRRRFMRWLRKQYKYDTEEFKNKLK